MKVWLTEDGLDHILERLRVVYGIPQAWKTDPVAYGREWMNVLKGYRVEELNSAVDRWVQSGEKFRPKPGDLKALCYIAKPTKQVYRVDEADREEACLCGDPSCRLRLYRMPSGHARLAMDCLARQYHYQPVEAT